MATPGVDPVIGDGQAENFTLLVLAGEVHEYQTDWVGTTNPPLAAWFGSSGVWIVDSARVPLTVCGSESDCAFAKSSLAGGAACAGAANANAPAAAIATARTLPLTPFTARQVRASTGGRGRPGCEIERVSS